MRNKLADLNNYLFAQIERLDDEEKTGDELDIAIKRGTAIVDVAAQIIANGNLQLKAASTAYEMGFNIKGNALIALVESDEKQS